jgi:hypothetical protein
LKEEYVRKLGLILNIELNARNKMQAIGSLAMMDKEQSYEG